LTLSAPPTPGNSIVKRPDNGGLFSLGEVFRKKGYEALYLYGGYAYFDKHGRVFFSGNGYTVIDRTALKPDEISFENILGAWPMRTVQAGDCGTRQALHGAQTFLRAHHDRFESPPLRLPGRTHRHSHRHPRGRGEVHRFRDRAVHRQGARQALVRPDAFRHRRGPYTQGAAAGPSCRSRTTISPSSSTRPRQVPPRRVDTIASQIDVGPYDPRDASLQLRSLFFGHDTS